MQRIMVLCSTLACVIFLNISCQKTSSKNNSRKLAGAKFSRIPHLLSIKTNGINGALRTYSITAIGLG